MLGRYSDDSIPLLLPSYPLDHPIEIVPFQNGAGKLQNWEACRSFPKEEQYSIPQVRKIFNPNIDKEQMFWFNIINN